MWIITIIIFFFFLLNTYVFSSEWFTGRQFHRNAVTLKIIQATAPLPWEWYLDKDMRTADELGGALDMTSR